MDDETASPPRWTQSKAGSEGVGAEVDLIDLLTDAVEVLLASDEYLALTDGGAAGDQLLDFIFCQVFELRTSAEDSGDAFVGHEIHQSVGGHA